MTAPMMANSLIGFLVLLIAAVGILFLAVLYGRIRAAGQARRLDRHRSTEAGLSDLLNYAAMVDEGVIVCKLRTPTSETETISEISAEIEPMEQAAENIHMEIWEVEQTADMSLQERLHSFDMLHIKPIFPDTPEEQRLLRQEMIDALLEHLPCSKAEFLELIPAFLRAGTSTDEAKLFLEPVLQLVSDFA